ncbi:sugar phosphate isomerase/epimerase family protein [Paenibacillus arenilitoris]|uniref:Sugar phosphate isomerase/epimerase n=1 Tax=Paenibacillus arenilitoris TaxID=2772299 RepID=A0A927H5W1_9BACL|nr:sugar phosphate isomerase/epimerase [Paenibacillus arenilitoris]MBD2868847.1 sugar phosphate isomerase/epimerase [Paenibacillus arenilitoris]
MKRSQIAAQLYTLRDFCKTEDDLRRTLGKVREIGYEAVQVSGVGPIAPEAIKQIADEAGLRICATHVSFEALQNDFAAEVRKHKLWNCGYVGIGSIPKEYQSGAEGYAAFAREASEVGRRLKEQGLQFIYHNHQFEFEKFGGRTGMDILLAESDADAFGFELDTYWVHVGGVDPTEMVRRVSGRMGVVHLKDLAIDGRQQVFAEIGEGNLNFNEIIQACRETGVEWYVVEQDVCRRDPFESLAISFKYLTTLAL